MTYNGYTNYATWAVGMFLDGNYTGEGTYREALDIAEEVGPDAGALADALREYVTESVSVPEGEGAGLASDLIGTALDEVNWHELAEAKIAEVAES